MLKYIGKDGLNGLINGNRYHVDAFIAKNGKYWADIYLTSGEVNVLGLNTVGIGSPFVVAVYKDAVSFLLCWEEV